MGIDDDDQPSPVTNAVDRDGDPLRLRELRADLLGELSVAAALRRVARVAVGNLALELGHAAPARLELRERTSPRLGLGL